MHAPQILMVALLTLTAWAVRRTLYAAGRRVDGEFFPDALDHVICTTLTAIPITLFGTLLWWGGFWTQ